MESPLHYSTCCRRADSFRLNGKLPVLPFAPTAFKGINLGKTFFHHFQCHTGTRMFITSSAIENDRLLPVVVVDPLVNSSGIDTFGAGNFHR